MTSAFSGRTDASDTEMAKAMVDFPDKTELRGLTSNYNRALAAVPEALTPSFHESGFKRISGKTMWKKNLKSHSLLIQLMQLRWLTGILVCKVILKGIPVPYRDMNRKAHFKKSGNHAHLSTNSLEHRREPYKGIPFLEGIEPSVDDAKTCWKLMEHEVGQLEDWSGLIQYAASKAETQLRCEIVGTYPHFTLAAIAAKEGRKDSAKEELEKFFKRNFVDFGQNPLKDEIITYFRTKHAVL